MYSGQALPQTLSNPRWLDFGSFSIQPRHSPISRRLAKFHYRFEMSTVRTEAYRKTKPQADKRHRSVHTHKPVNSLNFPPAFPLIRTIHFLRLLTRLVIRPSSPSYRAIKASRSDKVFMASVAVSAESSSWSDIPWRSTNSITSRWIRDV